MKFLIAADSSPFSKHMLEYVVTLPELINQDNEYMVLTVVLDVPPHAATVVGSETVRESVMEYYADEAERVLNPVCQFFEMHGCKVKTTYQVGQPR